MAGILGSGGMNPPGILGNMGGQSPFGPQIPWAQNPLVTTLGASLLAGRTPQKGLESFAQALPYAMQAKQGMQQQMMANQEKAASKAEADAEVSRMRAAMNAAVKLKSKLPLTPEDQAALEASPEVMLKFGFTEPDKPMVVGADSQIYNPTTGEWSAPPGGGPTKRPDFGDVSGFRKEIQALPSYKNVSQAAPIYTAMVQTFPNKTRASDLNLVYGLGKIMDPGSVVREGEMVMVKDTASLPDWLLGEINRVNGGSALQEQTRRDILAEAKTRMDAYTQQWDQDAEQYKGIAERYGIPVEDAIPAFGPLPAIPSAAPSAGPRVPAPDAPPPANVDPVLWDELKRRGLPFPAAQ